MHSLIILFLAFCVFILAAYFFWIDRRFTGGAEMRTPSGRPYYWYHRKRNGRRPALTVLSLEFDAPFNFTLEAEGRMHRLAKWFGLASEFQTRDEAFDRSIYILSDVEDFGRGLQNHDTLRGLFMKLFSMDIDSISADVKNRRLVAEFTESRQSLDGADAETIVGLLREIAGHLSGAGEEGIRRDSTLRRNAQIAIGLFFVCLFGGLLLGPSMPYHLRDNNDMLWLAFSIGMLASVVMIALIKVLFGASSQGYRVLHYFIMAGIGGMMAASYDATYYLNYSRDATSAETRVQRIIEKHTTRGRRSTSYYVTVESWRDRGKPVSLRVNSDEFRRAEPGGRMRILTHPGYLGHEWLESYVVQ